MSAERKHEWVERLKAYVLLKPMPGVSRVPRRKPGILSTRRSEACGLPIVRIGEIVPDTTILARANEQALIEF
jgi:hypothetical protein